MIIRNDSVQDVYFYNLALVKEIEAFATGTKPVISIRILTRPAVLFVSVFGTLEWICVDNMCFVMVM